MTVLEFVDMDRAQAVEASDAELAGWVAESVEDRSAAEEELCQRLGRRVRLYGLRHLRDEQAAADLMQQVLLLTLEALRGGKLRDPQKLASFVFGACRMVVLEIRRGGARRAQLMEQYRFEAIRLSQPSEPGWDLDRLAHCLHALPERERSVIVMTFYENERGGDIAESLGLSAVHARVIRHRALTRLRGCLGGVQ